MQPGQNNKKAVSMLWITAAIWGFAFVAQRKGMEYIGPFTFNGIRFALGSLSLLPLLFILKQDKSTVLSSGLSHLKTGLIAGIVLFAGASLQQAGMVWTSAGKAGFITGLYVIFVPILGILIGQHIHKYTWAGAILAVSGLFLLTVNEKLSISKGDLLVLTSALFWAIHVQLINRLVVNHSPLKISVIQFAVCAILSLFTAGLIETIEYQPILDAALPLLYGGLMSVGIAYTLQVFAQRHVHPTYATIILSFETVFAAIGGWLLLGETLSVQGLIGCVLMLAGMWVVQKGQ